MRWLVGVMMVVAACGGGDAGPRAGTPREAFESMVAALRAGDLDRYWELLAPEARDALEPFVAELRSLDAATVEQLLGFPREELDGLEGKRLFKKLFESPELRESWEAMPAARDVEVDVDGDRAVVYWRDDERGECRVGMIRKTGGWRGADRMRCKKMTPPRARATPVPVSPPPPDAAPATGTVKIIVEPAGARVRLDNVEVGVAPLTLTVTPGRHALSIDLPRYQGFTTELELAPDETQTVRVLLEPAP